MKAINPQIENQAINKVRGGQAVPEAGYGMYAWSDPLKDRMAYFYCLRNFCGMQVPQDVQFIEAKDVAEGSLRTVFQQLHQTFESLRKVGHPIVIGEAERYERKVYTIEIGEKGPRGWIWNEFQTTRPDLAPMPRKGAFNKVEGHPSVEEWPFGLWADGKREEWQPSTADQLFGF